MPLILPLLQAQLIQIFRAQSNDVGEIAGKIADAYRNYVLPALGPAGDPVILKGIEQIPLRQNLTEIFRNRLPQATAASLVGIAITQFWLAPPVQTPLAGFVTACVPAPGVASMQAVMASSIEDAAKDFGSALDQMTKTVIVTYPPMIHAPGPLT